MSNVKRDIMISRHGTIKYDWINPEKHCDKNDISKFKENEQNP